MTTQALIDQYVAQQRKANEGKSGFWKELGEMMLACHVELLRRGLRSLVTVRRTSRSQ